MKSLTPTMFVFSKYWGCWSRVLSLDHPKGPYVEVNLTPISFYFAMQNAWDRDVSKICVRFHGTSYNDRSVTTCLLPDRVKKAMEEHLPKEVIDRLLIEDILSLIDYEKYRVVDNGGADLEDILLDP